MRLIWQATVALGTLLKLPEHGVQLKFQPQPGARRTSPAPPPGAPLHLDLLTCEMRSFILLSSLFLRENLVLSFQTEKKKTGSLKSLCVSVCLYMLCVLCVCMYICVCVCGVVWYVCVCARVSECVCVFMVSIAFAEAGLPPGRMLCDL